MKPLSLAKLEQTLEYHFEQHSLLERALTHSSYAREDSAAPGDNEQLEFLGDAVLQLVVSRELFDRYPQYQEGALSKLRAHLVNAKHLVGCGTKIKLGAYLRLGHGEEKTGGRSKPTLISDAMEALLAAMYLDGGMEPARRFILTHILTPELERLEAQGGLEVDDSKTLLQQKLRAQNRPEPLYTVLREDGPGHNKVFTMNVIVCDEAGMEEFTCVGEGPTKKAASQVAAARALLRLEANARG